MRSVVAAIALFATACASAGTTDAGNSTTTLATPAPQFSVTIDQTGGCLMMGPNCARIEVESTGVVSVYRLGNGDPEFIAEAAIDPAVVDNLGRVLAATDLAALRSRLGPGECRGCYDGLDTEVTFVVDGVSTTFSSIDVEFDPSEPVFAALDSVITVASNVEIPPLQREVTLEPAATAQIYAAAVAQIVTVDNTFGGAPIFSTILVVDTTDPSAGDPAGSSTGRPLTDAERAAIANGLGDSVDTQFVRGPDDYRTDDLLPVIEGSAIVTVGEIEMRESDAIVGMSLWCGGLCGTWLTYRVVPDGGGWVVDGIEGPIAIS